MQDVEISRLLDQIDLGYGAHENRDDGMCAMELVACIGGEPHNFAPACASEILTGYTIRLNDHMGDHERPALKPFLPRIVGTSGGNELLRFEAMARSAFAGIFVQALRKFDAPELALELNNRSSLPAHEISEWFSNLSKSDGYFHTVARKHREFRKSFQHIANAGKRARDVNFSNWNWSGGELGLAVADVSRLAGIQGWSMALQVLEAGIDACAGNPPKAHKINKRLHLIRAY